VGALRMDTFLTIKQVVELGVSEATIWRKTRAGEWEYVIGERASRYGEPPKLIKLSSLTKEMQLEWARRNESAQAAAAPDEKPVEDECQLVETNDLKGTTSGLCEIPSLDRLNLALRRFPIEERDAWLAELNRLAAIVQKFSKINPKRIKNAEGKYEFVAEIQALCNEAACSDSVILGRESHRAEPPSPYTLDGWLRGYRKNGLLTFIRSKPTQTPENGDAKRDRRRAEMTPAAAEWVNTNWRNYRSPRALYKALQKKAKRENWLIPAESWMYRRWKELPEIVITKHLKGEKAYQSTHAPYIPRTAADLAALQLLCGDHRQCDVAVLWRDGRTLIRPWLTLWQDVRTGLIWGWHLDLTPSSQTIGLAYAAGITQFGAQPPARPDEGFASYVYTDNGKDYKSQNLDGTITVHKRAATFDGGFELIRTEQRIGLYSEMDVRKLLARGYNAKEKPIERTNRDLADWEEQEFDEWCGRDAKNRPDLYGDLYHQHQRFVGGHRGESPFMPFDSYFEALAGWIIEYNSSEHTRSVLENAVVVPIREYERLYPTRFEVSQETLAMLLMKPDQRVIGKIGVGCKEAYPTWRYWHPAMSEFKGKTVEIHYDPNDLSRVFVILPNGQLVEAELVQKSGYLTPNKQTATLMKQTEARERRLIREHSLLTMSRLRGETLEERVAVEYEIEQPEEVAQAVAGGDQSRIHRITRLDKPALRAVPGRTVTVDQVATVEPDESIFVQSASGRVSEFDFENEP
jgi:Mu transposase, C-terminal/Bacteriophage Mu transposase